MKMVAFESICKRPFNVLYIHIFEIQMPEHPGNVINSSLYQTEKRAALREILFESCAAQHAK